MGSVTGATWDLLIFRKQKLLKKFNIKKEIKKCGVQYTAILSLMFLLRRNIPNLELSEIAITDQQTLKNTTEGTSISIDSDKRAVVVRRKKYRF